MVNAFIRACGSANAWILFVFLGQSHTNTRTPIHSNWILLNIRATWGLPYLSHASYISVDGDEHGCFTVYEFHMNLCQCWNCDPKHFTYCVTPQTPLFPIFNDGIVVSCGFIDVVTYLEMEKNNFFNWKLVWKWMTKMWITKIQFYIQCLIKILSKIDILYSNVRI